MEVPLSQTKARFPTKALLPTKGARRPRATPATYEDLFQRLTALADDALRLGYPFTAEHLMHLAEFVIKGESSVSARIARDEAGAPPQARYALPSAAA